MVTTSPTTSDAELASHHGHINRGSSRAVLAVLVSFSGMFLLFATLSLPWTTVLLQRGGWRKGWWLSGQSTVLDAWGPKRGGKRRSSVDLGRPSGGKGGLSSTHREGVTEEDEPRERPWSPPPLDDSKPLRRIPIPPGIPVHSRTIPWLNLSVLQIITFLPFVIVIALASSIGSSFLDDATRTGYVALAMLPFVVGLSVKSWGLGTILQQGYAAINWLHRWMGRLLWLVVTIHVIAYMTAFGKDGTLADEMKRRVNIDAWISYFGLNLMMLLSLRPVRRSHYQTFKVCHHIGLAFFIGGLNFHSPFVFPFLMVVILYITSNYIYRWTTTRIHTAHLSTLPGSRTALVHIPSVNRGWFPGQHCRIRVFSSRFGIAGWESHPFTVASAELGDGVRLLCKINGSWTQKLHDLAAEGMDEDGLDKPSLNNTVPMSLEGPYGQAAFVSSLFSSVLVVAGGSGVSFALSIAESVICDVQSGKGRTRELVVVWSVREPGDVDLLQPLFASLFTLSSSHPSTSSRLIISVLIFCTTPTTPKDPTDPLSNPTHYLASIFLPKSTEAPTSPPPRTSSLGTRAQAQAIEMSSPDVPPLISPDNLPSISFGKRPPLREILKGVTDRAVGKGGVCVAACGPDALVHQMGDACIAVDKVTLKRVGGVEFNPQSFVL